MPGNYKIIQSQLPLVFGFSGHNLITVMNDSGQVIHEFNGLAVDSSGNIKAIGYWPSDKLKVFDFTSKTYYDAGQAQQVVFSGSEADVMARVSAMQSCAAQMNANDMGYPFLGFGKNSNSVESTLMRCIGVTETAIPYSAPIMIGVGDILLPSSFIDSVKTMNGISAASSSAWDTGTTYDNYYDTPSYGDVFGNFSCYA